MKEYICYYKGMVFSVEAETEDEAREVAIEQLLDSISNNLVVEELMEI